MSLSIRKYIEYKKLIDKLIYKLDQITLALDVQEKTPLKGGLKVVYGFDGRCIG